ncbi:MAG: phosphatidate cytidylyltransferase, partial [Pseudomonadales bacterium]|nr:phosphatidate cytidylyltransferase [Pseudomonadales bacterium]
MLKQRIITALILMSGLLLALFSLSPSQFNYVLLVILALGAWEWSDLSALSQQWQRVLYSLFVVSLTYLLAVNFHFLPGLSGAIIIPIRFLDVMGLAGLFWAVALLWVLNYPASKVIWGHSLFRAIIGVFVIVPAILAVMFILSLPQSQWLFLYVLGIVVVADVGAYFTGSRFGGAKLAAAVSPGKSWSGFWGGVVCALIYAMLLAWYFPQPE